MLASQQLGANLQYDYYMHTPQHDAISTTWLVTPTESQSLKPGDYSTDISKVDQFWIGVRGTRHYQRALERTRQSTYAVLVPQRSNPHDSTAVAILAGGSTLIGYVPRSMAHSLYSQLGYLKMRGHKLQVPLKVQNNQERSCLDAWACVPTRKGIDKAVPVKLLIKSFMPAWNALNDTIRIRIAKNGFHLDSETGPLLWKKANYATDFHFSGKFDEDNVDPGVTFALQKLREKRNKDAINSRKKRNKSIVADRNSGMTNAEISNKRGVSTSLVQNVLRSSGLSSIKPKTSGLSEDNITSLLERARKCLLAADEQARGLARKTIADEMGIGLKTVEKYLTDGNFYRDLTRNPSRKKSIEIMLSNPHYQTLTDDKARQARADIIVIRHFELAH